MTLQGIIVKPTKHHRLAFSQHHSMSTAWWWPIFAIFHLLPLTLIAFITPDITKVQVLWLWLRDKLTTKDNHVLFVIYSLTTTSRWWVNRRGESSSCVLLDVIKIGIVVCLCYCSISILATKNHKFMLAWRVRQKDYIYTWRRWLDIWHLFHNFYFPLQAL